MVRIHTHMYISILIFTYKYCLVASKQFENVFKMPAEYPIYWICPYLLVIIEINCAIYK